MVHENGPRVMTNGPDIQWRWRNLNTRVHLSPSYPYQNDMLQVKTNDAVGTVPRPIGHGWNLFGLPGDTTSPSRFIRLFYLRGYSMEASPITNFEDAVVLGTSVMPTARPARTRYTRGVSRSGSPGRRSGKGPELPGAIRRRTNRSEGRRKEQRASGKRSWRNQRVQIKDPGRPRWGSNLNPLRGGQGGMRRRCWACSVKFLRRGLEGRARASFGVGRR